MVFNITAGIKSSRCPIPDRRHNLPQFFRPYVARRKNPGSRGGHLLVRLNEPERVTFDCAGNEIAIGMYTHENENTVHGQMRNLGPVRFSQDQSFDPLGVSLNLASDGIQNERDLGVLGGLFLDNLSCSKTISPMHNVDVSCELGQVDGLFDRRVPTSNDGHLLVSKTGRHTRHSMKRPFP